MWLLMINCGLLLPREGGREGSGGSLNPSPPSPLRGIYLGGAGCLVRLVAGAGWLGFAF